MWRQAKANRHRTTLAIALAAALLAAIPPTAPAAVAGRASSATGGRIAFPFIAGTAAVNHPPARMAPPSRSQGAMLAGIVAAVEARSRPGGGRNVWWVGTATSWSSEPQVLLVLGSAYNHGREWLQVLLPIRPNDTTGWIPRDNAVLLSTRYWLTVDKNARIPRSTAEASSYTASRP
jgi:hypothetical protein